MRGERRWSGYPPCSLDLVAKGWDAKKRVLDHLSEYPQPVASKQPTPKVRRRGCLAAVVSAATVVAVLVAALNIW